MLDAVRAEALKMFGRKLFGGGDLRDRPASVQPKRAKPEEIVTKLRQFEALVGHRARIAMGKWLLRKFQRSVPQRTPQRRNLLQPT